MRIAQEARSNEGAEPRFREDELVEVARALIAALGTPPDIAEVVARSLVLANLVGHDSHGIVRLTDYCKAALSGQIRPEGRPAVTGGKGATATVDGAWGFGQPAARLATEVAVDRSSAHGVAAVAISSCNHIGRLGEYVATIARARKIGMVFCNSGPAVAPFGGIGRALGTNPFAWSAPLAEGEVVLDFATANVAEGKLRVARADGRQAPPGSIVDAQGRPSREPADFYAGGALLPFGAHKGSGMSMLIELTGALLSSMGSSCDPSYQGGNGTVVLALDPEAFVSFARYLEQASTFCDEVRRLGGGAEHLEVLLPGEVEARTLAERREGGVRVADEIRCDLTELADQLGAELGRFALR